MGDYTSRDALLAALEKLTWYQPVGKGRLSVGAPSQEKAVYKAADVYNAVNDMPAADVIEMPKGKPGDFLLWDTGCGYQKLYAIEGVCIYPEGIFYDLGDICTVANCRDIVKIMSREEAKKELRGDHNGKEA